MGSNLGHIVGIIGAHQNFVCAEHLDQVFELMRRKHDRHRRKRSSDRRSEASATCRGNPNVHPKHDRFVRNRRPDSRRRAPQDIEIGMALQHAVENQIVQRDAGIKRISDDVIKIIALNRSAWVNPFG